MITLANILEHKQELLHKVQILGFANLNLAIYQGELYFLVERNPCVEGDSIESDFLLEGAFKTILGCNLHVRMQSTTEEAFWMTFKEGSVNIDNIMSLPQKIGLQSLEEITFEELSAEDKEQLWNIPVRIEEERQQLKIKGSELFLSVSSMFAPQEPRKVERLTQPATTPLPTKS